MMKVTGPFSERLKTSKMGEQPSVHQYDVLPSEFRVQVATILIDTLGNSQRRRLSQGYVPASLEALPGALWARAHRDIAYYRGVFELVPNARNEQDAIIQYLQEAETLPTLDALEILFGIVSSEGFRGIRDHDRELAGMRVAPDVAIDVLNKILRRHDLGYSYSGGMIVRIDDTFLHEEVVEPALALLHEVDFKGASDEFLSAHRHYRRGELKDAITDANNAFESTLKTICRKRGINLSGKEKTEQLVDTVMGILIPKHMQTYFDGLRAAMKGLPVLRNNTAGAAHGQGETPQDVVDHAAAFALHLSAANIVFLIQAWQELERREPKSKRIGT